MAIIKPVEIKKRGNSFQLYFYNPSGERRRVTVGSDQHQAQRVAVKFTDWLLEGKDPEEELGRAKATMAAQRVTIREFFPTFMDRHAAFRSESMRENYRGYFKNISRCPALIDSSLSSITKRMVLDYMHLRMKTDGVTSATVNREAAFLKCMFSKAVEWEMLGQDTLKGLKLFPEAEKRDVYLSREQAEELISRLPEPVSSIVQFAIYTGFRKENILSLCVESIRFNKQAETGEVELIIKGGRRELFPLGPLAVEVLRRNIGKRTSGFVFINPNTGTRYLCVHKTFDRAVTDLNLKVGNTKLRFHDLRHVFATWLHREGVSLDLLRPLMGHKKRETTDRYTSIDRLYAGKVLTLMPSIERKDMKKASNQ